MIQINYRDPQPIYEQLRDGFRQLILMGVREPHAKMASVRELAATASWRPRAASVRCRDGAASSVRRTQPCSPAGPS